jgi:hypothetical protein
MQNESGSQDNDQEPRSILDWGQILVDAISGRINDESFQALMNRANRETVARVNLETDLSIHPSVPLETILASSDELSRQFADRDVDPETLLAGIADSVQELSDTDPVFDFLFEERSAPVSPNL